LFGQFMREKVREKRLKGPYVSSYILGVRILWVPKAGIIVVLGNYTVKEGQRRKTWKKEEKTVICPRIFNSKGIYTPAHT